MPTQTYDLQTFVADLEKILDQHPSMPVKVKEVSGLVTRLCADGSWLEERWRQPRDDSYARYLLHRDRMHRFVVLSLVWLPGQATPIHNHDCWGVMGILENALEEVHYERLDDGSNAERAELRESNGLLVSGGSTSYVLPPYHEIHRIGNPTRQPTVSVHVYGRDIDEVKVFDLVTKKVSKMRIKYYGAGLDCCDFVI